MNSVLASERAIVTLQRFALHIGRPVILQWRQAPFAYVAGDVHLLQDRSGGRGALETEWFAPDELCRKAGAAIGYAGGLSPSNIAEQLPRIAEAAGGMAFWIDCESGVRTDDWLDPAKVEAMAAAVLDFLRSGSAGMRPNGTRAGQL